MPIKCDSVTVELGERSYDIIIGSGTLGGTGERLVNLCNNQFSSLGKNVVVVSNPTVYALYGELLISTLKAAGFQVNRVLLPDGEQYKDIYWLNYLLSELLQMGLDRKSTLVALGGGVIGDITGFAASTYMRGINYVQVPTTLLSQVDSSVGGKTGVNHPLGKNMIGTFYQPRMVIIDVETLGTLPRREISAGMAEVIKYGIIWDSEFFEYLVTGRERILSLEEGALCSIIRRSCEIKASVVSKDEREAGIRAILNYGHTVGHAIETATGYKRYLHGEAVAIGMYVEGILSNSYAMLDIHSLEKIRSILDEYLLSWQIPPDVGRQSIMEAMYHDKKAVSGSLKFVLAGSIGSVEVIDGVNVEKIVAALG